MTIFAQDTPNNEETCVYNMAAAAASKSSRFKLLGTSLIPYSKTFNDMSNVLSN